MKVTLNLLTKKTSVPGVNIYSYIFTIYLSIPTSSVWQWVWITFYILFIHCWSIHLFSMILYLKKFSIRIIVFDKLN